MTKFEKFMILFLIIFFTSLSYAVIKTAGEVRKNVTQEVKGRQVEHLPSVCQQYYNNGTDQWIECMGVGRK